MTSATMVLKVPYADAGPPAVLRGSESCRVDLVARYAASASASAALVVTGKDSPIEKKEISAAAGAVWKRTAQSLRPFQSYRVTSERVPWP